MNKTMTDRLLDLQQRFEQAETQRDQTKGALTQQQQEMKRLFGITDLKAGRAKYDELTRQISTLEQEIEKGVAGMEQELDKLDQTEVVPA